ncbi:aminodeoxychorismate synthase component I [Arthrobacter russicus]|uniref:aminodeoxychorismate synthase component I n=1 Tax=Arthrobacter russicus TaxID=172040 RepID=UPI003CF69DF5
MSEAIPAEPAVSGASGGGAARRPVIIAVDGRSGSGKTSLALELASLLREHRKVSVFHLEDVYPGWNGLSAGVDRYLQTVLNPLHRGVDAQWTSWDWSAHFDGEARQTTASDVVIVEGVGAAQAPARPMLDAVIWVEAAEALRKERALARDGETYAPYWDLWAAQEAELLAADHPAEHADLRLDSPVLPSDVLQALGLLPQLKNLLAPELQREHARATLAAPVPFTGDPAGLFEALFGHSENAVWLDSSDAQQRGERSRFSIMADDGGDFGQIAWHRDGMTRHSFRGITVEVPGPFFRWLDAQWPGTSAPIAGGLPFSLGWIGYLGYELKRETGGSRQSPDTPDAGLLHAGRAVVVDHQEQLAWALSLADDGWPETVTRAAAKHAPGTAARPDPTTVSVRDDRSAYKTKIGLAQAQIFEGNSYEICLTTGLAFRTDADPLGLYRTLRQANPAPFAAFLAFGGLSILSTSPERLLRMSPGGALTAEPIKGTRRRDPDPGKDAELRSELAASVKDRAENLMIVDLMRNDLSHFALPGSVRVSRLCAIESYATVHQMVSTVEARLRPGTSRSEAIAAAFPAGSMTGAPKISTMRILDQLEAAPRGAYSGAIGYFSRDGGSDLSVLIRTLVLDHGQATLGVGGAITADSAPEEEWQEVRAKAFGVLDALGLAFPDD